MPPALQSLHRPEAPRRSSSSTSERVCSCVPAMPTTSWPRWSGCSPVPSHTTPCEARHVPPMRYGSALPPTIGRSWRSTSARRRGLPPVRESACDLPNGRSLDTRPQVETHRSLLPRRDGQFGRDVCALELGPRADGVGFRGLRAPRTCCELDEGDIVRLEGKLSRALAP